MGTRAIYIFEDDHEEVHVYKHYDNYPQGAVDFIENAKEYAWELPRFEADEFAAAFVAANKNRKGGEVRLVNARFKHGVPKVPNGEKRGPRISIIGWGRRKKMTKRNGGIPGGR